MDDSEENMSTEDINYVDSPMSVKIKPKKRSLIERELETNLTARVTSPATGEGSSTSRYGRARKLKTASELDSEKIMKPLKIDVSKQPQAYKMHASNSPISKESPKRTISVGSSIEDQIENIYNENISLSRFGSEEKLKSQSPAKKLSKVYIRKDLIQKPDTDTVVLIKNMFSPNKSNSHLNNILERSSEKYSLNGHGKALNGFPDTLSVVKILDFDGKKKKPVSPVTQSKKKDGKEAISPVAQPSKKELKEKLQSPKAQLIKKEAKDQLVSPIAQPIKKEIKEKVVSKNELFELEAACDYQVGDLAWARVGTYPFWPCIVTREPFSDTFVKKKLFGRVERSVIHVTFFGDNGRRGWIVDNMLRKYHGRAEFEACRDKFTPESKKKDPRLYAAHFVSEKKIPLWNVSVEEAETLMKEPKRLRIDALYDMLEKARAAKTTPNKREKGGKITRTDSDVSLSESLYDTLFSEDDGKPDDNRSNRARNKSLNVSEVVTACLDNMAAKSGIIQIQRQSHMDRWLQKAKSKTPEKNQQLHIKIEKEKRKDKAEKKKEGKLHKTKRIESRGSDTNLLPYENEHDYSSVNYENHDINDSSNKNTDSASGLDSTLDTSTTASDIGVTVKIENISSSMEDCSQDDIITSVVSDDIVMTDSDNISKDNGDNHNETHCNYLSYNKAQNNNVHSPTDNRKDENDRVEIKEELPLNTSDLTNTIQPRRSKRKRQTLEDLNNSIIENKSKAPKLDLSNQKPCLDPTPSDVPKSKKNQKETKNDSEDSSTESVVETVTHSEKDLVQTNKHTTISKAIVDVLPVNSENTVTQSNVPTITNLDKETIQNSKVKSTELMLSDSKSASADVEPRPSKNEAIKSNIPNVIVIEKESSQSCKILSTDSKSTPVVDTEILYSENKPTESKVPTVTDFEKDSSQNNKVESTELDKKSKSSVNIEQPNLGITVKESNVPNVKNFEKNASIECTPFNNKSKPLVVIKPLAMGNNSPAVANLETETSKNSKLDSTELKILNSKCKPVVVIEQLNYGNTATETIAAPVENVEKEISQNNKLESMELSFHKSTKPVVVIEPLDMNGFETQLIVKGSKQIIYNNSLESVTENDNVKDKLETVGVSGVVKNDDIFLRSVDNATGVSSAVDDLVAELKTTQGEVSKISLHNTNKSLDDERMCVDDCESPAVEEKEAETSATSIIRLTEPTKTFDVPNQPLQINNDILTKNISTNVVIGEDTYIFDRTLSQDYDEIDADYDEYSHLPPVIITEEAKNAILAKNNLSSHEANSCEDNEIASKTQIPEENPNASDDNGPLIVENDSKLKRDCIFLDKGSGQNSSVTVTIEDNKVPKVTGDVSNVVNKEKHPNQVTEDNNDQCVFLDQDSKTADAQSAESLEKKRKSPRLSLNRTRNRTLKLNKGDNLLENPNTTIEKVNIDPDKVVVETASVDCNDSGKSTNSNVGRLHVRRDLKRSKTDPEFIKFMEIRQDALLDEQPDLTRHEIVNYLYQNWLYEEGKKSVMKKIDDNEQTNLVKGFEEPRQVKKIKKKPKVEKEAVRKNVDIRDILHKGKTKFVHIRPKVNCEDYSQEQAPPQNSNLQTVGSEKVKTEPKNGAKETTSTSNDRDKSITRRSWRSKQKLDTKKTMDELKDKTEECVQERAATSSKEAEKSTTRRLRLSREKHDSKQTIKTDPEKSTTEMAQNSNDSKILSNHTEPLKEEQDTAKAMKEPEFVKYLEIHQNAENNKSEIKETDDNRQNNLMNNQELDSQPKYNLHTNESSTTKANTVPEKCVIESSSSKDNDTSYTENNTRRSRRSKLKHDTKKTINGLKEMIGEKFVQDTPETKTLTISKNGEKSTTRRLRLSREKRDSRQTVKTDPEKSSIETAQTSSDSKVLTNHTEPLKEKQHTAKAMKETDFIKYLELNQDSLLDEQPDLTQDEIVTYLYKNWLDEESKKSELKKNDDNQHTLESQPKHNLHTNEINITIPNTDPEKYVVESTSSKDNEAANTENVEGPEKEKLDSAELMTRNCVVEMDFLKASEISVTKSRRRRSVKQDKKSANTEPETCIKEISPMDSKNSETTDPKLIGVTTNKHYSKKAMKEPEFVKYFEMHQNALIDEQPDLTQDEIITYLYQNWLYEEGNKSEMKKIDDSEQSNLVKGCNDVLVPQPKKIKKKPKVEKASEIKNGDIRAMLHKKSSRPVVWDSELLSDISTKGPIKDELPVHDKKVCLGIDSGSHESKDAQSVDTLGFRLNNIQDSKPSGTQEFYNLKDETSSQGINFGDNIETLKEISDEDVINPAKEAGNLELPNPITAITIANIETFQNSDDTEDMEFGIDEFEVKEKDGDESAHLKIINGFRDFDENSSISKIIEVCDPETASMKSEDSGASITRKARKDKDVKKSRDDPEFLKYLVARQDAIIEEQPDLTQEEIVTYLYQTWFYEESTKSDVKKSDETEQSNLVKGLNQEPLPQPKKIKKKPKVEKEAAGKAKSTDTKEIKIEKSDKPLRNADIRDMIQKPKRKATQSTPYYNEDDSDLEEEDLETFKIFNRDEHNEVGEEIDEVELYFEQLTKPKPNVFKGCVRERVCEICYGAGNLVKCKSCHGTYHVECVKKETEVNAEVAGPTRGRKKKRGRKPKGYDPLLDTGSQSDERSQDANNSEEMNISLEDEAETHIIIDEDNFETLWENKMKELQTDKEEEYVSDQEIDWEVEPGHCEIVDLKHKEKPIDLSDYKCNNCLKYETPVCFVCKSDKSPKDLIEIRQKCQVAHCHRYYHLECLDHWPQTQFNSWEPSKTNKKQIEYIEALFCPRHVCHTCVSDDPRGCKTRFSGDKLARCVKCPATYHSYTKCLPAGTQILTGSQIICPRHYEHRPGKVPCHVNTGWCFICALGGTLICCEYCPTSFHAECLNIKPPEGSYMCEDCETGRLPLYGEMVWVKLGHYRWWPGIVLHPTEIPDNIMAVKHSPGEFVVRFFGQYDHYWVNRGRVFPFQEGDSGRISSQKSKIDAAFTTAMEHAQRACEILKKMEPNEEEDLDIASSLLPPHYVKLKVNKPVGSVVRRDMDANSLTQCDCEPNQPDPCGPYSHCLNRMLLTECGPLCRAGERCNNRAFERRVYPRLQPYRTPQRGWGLRTLDEIKQGQFVIEYVGELIDMEEFRRRMCRKHEIRDENFYFLTLDKERMIDAGPKGNLARFMNHCCEPNCETQKWTVLGDVRVGLFAIYDIPANSEVTFNYNLECAGIEKKRCLCGAKRCSGYIGAKPKQLQEDKTPKTKLPKRTYKKRKPIEEPIPKPKPPKIKIKPIKPRELTEIEKDLLIIKNATNGISSDSEGRLSVDDKNSKALKRKRVSFSTDEVVGKKAKLAEETEAV